MLGDSAPQRFCIAVALGDENRMRSGQMAGWLAQRASGQQMLVSKGLLAVDQNYIESSATQLPVLKTIIQQQRIATEFLNGVSACLDPVFVDEDDDILEI